MAQDDGAEPANFGAVVEAIRALRRDGAALPAERLLAERLAIKRHQLRKALAYLRAQGELAPPARRGGGAAARSDPAEELVRLSNPIEVIELRLAIEPSLARLASLRASAIEIARVVEAATTAPGAEPGAADLAFHLAVAQAARNNLAEALYRMLRRVGTDSRIRVAGVPPTRCSNHVARRDAEHRAVAEAIAARDPDAAEAAMRAHLLAVEAVILERSTPGRVRAA